MEIGPGTRVGPYEVSALLGEGGMGKVWRARHTELKRDDALKVLPDAFASDPERLARFQREAQVLASLNHPNIAQIYGLQDIDGVKALVLELVDGVTLADLLAGRHPSRALPLREAVPIARQIAVALEAAHEAGVIHRDLKPANVKIRPDGTVKVLDFGLAKAIEPASAGPDLGPAGTANSPTITTPAMTHIGVILGTAAYMAPEQAKGRPVDKRADVWAFGCVLYEMLSGDRPFAGDDVTETLARVIDREPDWSRLPGDLPPVLGMFLRRCLQKNPKERLRDIADVRLALEGAFDTEAEGRVASSTEPLAPPSRLRWVWPVVALALGGVAAGLAWRSVTPPEAPIVARFAVPLPDGQTFTGTSRQTVAVSPDGTRIVYVANSQLHLRSLSQPEVRPIAGTGLGEAIYQPVFSPDGEWIAYFTTADGGSLKKVDIGSGAIITLCPAEAPAGMSWDRDGIVFGQPRGIVRVPENGGEAELLIAANGETLASPQVLPGGRHMLFTTLTGIATDTRQWDQASIVVQTLGSSERHIIVQGSDARYLPTGHLLYAMRRTMLAAPFDVSSLTVTGSPVPVLTGVRRPSSSAGSFTPPTTQVGVSATGVLAFVPGPADPNRGVDLAWLGRDGSVQPLGLTPAAYATPRVSPDGRHLAVVEGAEGPSLWILDLDAPAAPRRLTLEGQNRFPVWSPDSDRLAFQSDREGDAAMFWQKADGTEPAERLTTPEPGSTHVPYSWSRDGLLLFGVEKDARHSLWTLSLADRKSAPFGEVTSGMPMSAAFSPDGRWIAYVAGESPPTQHVFVQPFPATGARYQVSRPEGVGANPFWGPDGTELFYDGGGRNQIAVRITAAPRFAVGAPTTIPSGNRDIRITERYYDIDPGGTRFIIVLQSGEDPRSPQMSRIEVVVNWFTELNRLVPTN